MSAAALPRKVSTACGSDWFDPTGIRVPYADWGKPHTIYRPFLLWEDADTGAEWVEFQDALEPHLGRWTISAEVSP